MNNILRKEEDMNSIKTVIKYILIVFFGRLKKIY